MRGPALAPPPAIVGAPAHAPRHAPAPAALAPIAASQAATQIGPVTQWGGPPLGSAPPATNGFNGHANGALHPLAPPGGGFPPPMMAAAASDRLPVAATPALHGSAWSRRWPIIVVILAAAAIAVSIFLLVKGNEKAKSSKVKRSTVPTIDNGMNTNPLPPPPDDPWGQAPSLPPPDNDDDDDLSGGPGGGNPFQPPTQAPPKDKFFKTMYQTVVERLETCGAPKDTVTSLRAVLDQLGDVDAMDSLCKTYDTDQASACIKKLHEFPCVGMGSWDSSQVYSMFSGFSECSNACRP